MRTVNITLFGWPTRWVLWRPV